MRVFSAALMALLLQIQSSLAVAAAAPVEFWYGHTGAIGQAVDDLCAQFNESHPLLRPLKCIAQGSYEQTLQKTVAAYRAGKSPALVEIYDVATLDMLLGGAIVPVHQLFNQQASQAPASHFLPAVQRYYADHDQQLAAQPFAVSTAVLYGHRAQLAAAGINTPPATWEAFETALAALRKEGQNCPAVTDFNPWIWLEQSSAAMGTELASANNGAQGLHARYHLDQGQQPRLLADLVRWASQGTLVNQAMTRSGRQELAFAAGDCAMLAGSTAAWNLIAAGGADDVSVSPLPVYQDQTRHATVVGGAALWVLRGQPQDAYATVTAFLAYLRQPAVQMTFSERTGYLPITEDAVDGLLARLPSGTAVAVGLASLSDPGGQTSAPLRTGFLTLLRLLWTQEMQNALAGRETTDAALQHTTERGNVLLSIFQETYRHAPQP